MRHWMGLSSLRNVLAAFSVQSIDQVTVSHQLFQRHCSHTASPHILHISHEPIDVFQLIEILLDSLPRSRTNSHKDNYA